MLKYWSVPLTTLQLQHIFIKMQRFYPYAFKYIKPRFNFPSGLWKWNARKFTLEIWQNKKKKKEKVEKQDNSMASRQSRLILLLLFVRNKLCLSNWHFTRPWMWQKQHVNTGASVKLQKREKENIYWYFSHKKTTRILTVIHSGYNCQTLESNIKNHRYTKQKKPNSPFSFATFTVPH